MKRFLLRFFTWWNGATFGTLVWTSLYGEFVGEDEFGNRYYRTRGGKIDPTLGFERRWVIYSGVAEASTIPPSWHGWMHHTVDVPPTDGEGGAAAVVEAAPAEPHRHARRPPPDRLDAGAGPPPEGDRRLQGLDARALTLLWPVHPGAAADSGVPIRPFPAAFRVLARPLRGCCPPAPIGRGQWRDRFAPLV